MDSQPAGARGHILELEIHMPGKSWQYDGNSHIHPYVFFLDDFHGSVVAVDITILLLQDYLHIPTCFKLQIAKRFNMTFLSPLFG